MRAIKSLLTFLWMALSVIPMGTLLLIFSLFVSADRLWWWFAQPWLSGAIFATRRIGGVQYRVHGLENLPDKGDNQRIILCPKHQSTWETFFSQYVTPPVGLRVQAGVALHTVFWLVPGALEYGAYRPKRPQRSLE